MVETILTFAIATTSNAQIYSLYRNRNKQNLRTWHSYHMDISKIGYVATSNDTFPWAQKAAKIANIGQSYQRKLI